MHHTAVRVPLNIVLNPLDKRVHPHMRTRASSPARPGMQMETSSELLCWDRVVEADHEPQCLKCTQKRNQASENTIAPKCDRSIPCEL